MFVDKREYDKLHAVERAAEITIQRITPHGKEVKRTDDQKRSKRSRGQKRRKYSHVKKQ